MDRQTLQQIRGAKELIEETVETATRAVADAHKTIACWPFDVLARIAPIAGPVRTAERFQLSAIDGFYNAVLGISRLVGGGATYLLDHLEGWPEPVAEAPAATESRTEFAVPPTAGRRRRVTGTASRKAEMTPAPAGATKGVAESRKSAAAEIAAAKKPTGKKPVARKVAAKKPAPAKSAASKAGAGKAVAAPAAVPAARRPRRVAG